MFVLSLRGSALFPVTRNHEAAHSLKGSQKGCIGRKPVYNIEKNNMQTDKAMQSPLGKPCGWAARLISADRKPCHKLQILYNILKRNLIISAIELTLENLRNLEPSDFWQTPNSPFF